MGRRGPIPVPTPQKKLEGNTGHRALNDDEPKPGPFNAAPPAHLDEVAVREWHLLVPILQRMRVLSEADYLMLATLCQAYSTMVEAQERLSKSGLLLKSPNSDYIQQSPLISIVNKNAELVLKLSREFGLTPASRSRLHAEGGSEKKGSGLLNGDWDKRAG